MIKKQTPRIIRKLNRGVAFSMYLLLIMTVSVLGVVFRESAISSCSICVARFWATVGLIVFMSYVYLLKKISGKINHPFTIFVGAAFVCWLGQLLTLSLELTSNRLKVIETFSPTNFYLTAMYAVLSISMLCFAGLIVLARSEYDNQSVCLKKRNLIKSLKYTGFILMFVGSYSFFSVRLSNLALAADRGYGSILSGGSVESASSSNILTSSSMFFFPGIVFLYIAYKNNKTKRRLVLVPILASLFISFAAGGRGGGLSIIISLAWLSTVEIRSISRKKIVALLCSAFLLLGVMNTIADFRILTSDKNANSFVHIYRENGLSLNALTGPLDEFGYNIFSLYHTIQLVPDTQHYSYGYTYLASVLAILPSAFYGGHSYSAAAALPDWLQNKLALDYGPGYSISAESYYNFGWFGLGALIILGLILAKLMSNTKKGDYKSIRNGMIAILLYSNLLIARDTSLMVLRKYIYAIAIPLILIWFFYSILDTNHRKPRLV